MALYKRIWYPDIKIEVLDRSVVDILTSSERSSIDQVYYDEDLEREETRSFAINYGLRKGDESPVIRGFESEGVLYEINPENRLLIRQETSGQLFYDEDKIEGNNFVFEGNIEEFVQEFIKRGYKIGE